MHAVVVDVRIVDQDAAHQMLRERVVPMVSGAPGFVTGVWLEPEDGQGHSIAVFESEEQAQAMIDQMKQNPPNPAVEIVGASLRGVAEQA